MSTLSDVTLKIGSGSTPRGGKSVYTTTGTAFIRSQNVLDFSLEVESMARIDGDAADSLRNVSVQHGDVLVNITGDSVARCSVWERHEEARVSQHVAIVRPDPEKVSSRYLQYWLVAPAQKTHLLTLSSAGGSRKALTKAMLEGFPFGPHDLNTQRAIAEVLGALDDKIAANRRVIDASEELQLALFRRISRTGEHLRLGEMIRLMYGKALPQDMRVPGEVAVVGSGGVVGSHTEGLVSGPAVVVGRKGSVGTVHWIDRDAYPIDTTFWVEPIDELPLPYLHRLLESLPLNSMSSDSAVPGLNREHAYSLLLPAHDREDINRFARDVEGLIARSSLAERENQVLASTRDELLPLLMSGRITVGAASSHVEEVV